MNGVEAALLRTLCFFDVLFYPPTFAEWMSLVDRKGEYRFTEQELLSTARELIALKRVTEQAGRITLPGREGLVSEQHARAQWMPRKIRTARKVTKWLSRLSGVRFVALCNTTALGCARDESDLDFFIITRSGVLWQTRALAALPFKLSGRRPVSGKELPDAICLSFFVDDAALDLHPLMQLPDDPYFRYWFLSLLPLYDDGVGQTLWEANGVLRERHPYAVPWLVNPDLRIQKPILRLPGLSLLEQLARKAQERVLPPEIRASQGTEKGVIYSDHVLKFHAQDARASMREAYETRCHEYDVEP
ncbi:hypothetical protein KBA73_02505 [Patescibacteria group bacterium]|nr:hypothetical protein [Patescibacteria group bacterium]